MSATFLVVRHKDGVARVDTLSDAIKNNYRICVHKSHAATLTQINSVVKSYLVEADGWDQTVADFEAGRCKVVSLIESEMLKMNSEGKMCHHERSKNPIYNQPYGFPVADTVAKGIGVAVKHEYATWLSLVKAARPAGACKGLDEYELQPIDPRHCAGIMIVTAAFVLLSILQSYSGRCRDAAVTSGLKVKYRYNARSRSVAPEPFHSPDVLAGASPSTGSVNTEQMASQLKMMASELERLGAVVRAAGHDGSMLKQDSHEMHRNSLVEDLQ